MKQTLKLKQQRKVVHISRAAVFQFPLSDVEINNFDIETVSIEEVIVLSKKLGTISLDKKNSTLHELFSESDMIFGSQTHTQEEVNRVVNTHQKNYKALLLSFPFKCPVPAKTNYHTKPDLGELVYLQRLAHFCELAEQITEDTFQIVILEETEALSPVFGVDRKTCREFIKSLEHYVSILDIGSRIKLKPLIHELGGKEYSTLLKRETEAIKNDTLAYSEIIEEVLPTIIVSLNTTHLSVKKSFEFISKLQRQKNVQNTGLLSTAIRFVAFTRLLTQKQARYAKYKQCLQLSVSPKKGRIGILPTSAKILPHHGVPVVVYRGKEIREFSIMYFTDFLALYQNEHNVISEVRTAQDEFLFYRVIRGI